MNARALVAGAAGSLRRAIALALAALLLAPVAHAADLTAMPMLSSSVPITYPRLSGLANTTLQNKINQLLASQEAQDRQDRTDCIGPSDGNPKGDFDEVVRVTYLSPHYLSLATQEDISCSGAAYPNVSVQPLTIDLATGATVDLAKAFGPGFLTARDSKHHAAAYDLYLALASVREGMGDNLKDCREAIDAANPSFIMWLDGSANGGVVLYPDVPHVVQVCAVPGALFTTTLGPYLRDAALRTDLQQVISAANNVNDGIGTTAPTPPLGESCGPADLPKDAAKLHAYRIRGADQAHFYRTAPLCPGGELTCRSAAFLLPTQSVLGGDLQDSNMLLALWPRWLCGFYPTAKGMVTGWLPSGRLEEQEGATDDWVGTWKSNAGAIQISLRGKSFELAGIDGAAALHGSPQPDSNDGLTLPIDPACHATLRHIGPYLAVSGSGKCPATETGYAGIYQRSP